MLSHQALLRLCETRSLRVEPLALSCSVKKGLVFTGNGTTGGGRGSMVEGCEGGGGRGGGCE